MQGNGERCVFCEISSGSAPASFIYRDPKVMAFMDARPISPGHTLVAPREHWPSILELPPALNLEVFALVRDIARAINEAFQPQGLNILQNNGRAALQSVPHLHVHLIPRYPGDDLSQILSVLVSRRRHEMPSRSQLDEAARSIAGRFTRQPSA